MICCVRSHVEGAREDSVIEMRRAQLSFGDGLIAEEVSDLREGWMEHADRVLADEQIVAAVYEALARRHPKSRSRGRLGAPAEMVLRLLILKHIRNWSYGVLEREVRANLVYRDFTRVGAGKTPDAKTMGRWGLAVGPEVVKQIHQRLVKLAQPFDQEPRTHHRIDAPWLLNGPMDGEPFATRPPSVRIRLLEPSAEGAATRQGARQAAYARGAHKCFLLASSSSTI
jgi:Transposase domain (DUF772)